MVEKTFLLSLLEFVALVAPVIAILMQAIVAFHDDIGSENSGPPVEFRILQWSLIIVIFGGLLIGIRLLQFIDDPLVYAGVVLIFGSLPFLAIVLWLTNTRASWRSNQSLDFHHHVSNQARNIFSIGFSLTLIAGIYITVSYFSSDFLNKYIQYGLFSKNDSLSPALFFQIVTFLLGIRVVLELNSQGFIPNQDFGVVTEKTIISYFTYLVMMTMFVAPVFIVFSLMSIYVLPLFGLDNSSSLLNIPYLWTVLTLFIAFSTSLDYSDKE